MVPYFSELDGITSLESFTLATFFMRQQAISNISILPSPTEQEILSTYLRELSIFPPHCIFLPRFSF